MVQKSLRTAVIVSLETTNKCLRYNGTNGSGLHGYSNSSLGEHSDDPHSTSGSMYMLLNCATSCSSFKHSTIAQNITESENKAMTAAATTNAESRTFTSD